MASSPIPILNYHLNDSFNIVLATIKGKIAVELFRANKSLQLASLSISGANHIANSTPNKDPNR